jgi:hypothetical protein
LAIANGEQSSVSGLLFTTYSTAVDNGAMNNFGICLQKCKEHFKSRMLFFVVNGALNALRYWQLRDDASSDVHHVFPIPTAR